MSRHIWPMECSTTCAKFKMSISLIVYRLLILGFVLQSAITLVEPLRAATILACTVVSQKSADDKSKRLVFPPDAMIRIEHNGRSHWGRPIAWNGKTLALVGLDGQLNSVPVESQQDIEISPDRFQPYDASTLKKRLSKEFGSRYDVTITQHFVVVHPRGDSEIWAPPFEALYERFRFYFDKQKFDLEQPEFPLVAIVLRSRSEFDRYLDKNAVYHRNVLGIYQVPTNRMVTYDPKAKLRTARRDKGWLFEYDTVIHELAHQAAFNTGVHNRFAPPPRWVGEGLAMMFETDGINNSKRFKGFKRRINRPRLKKLKQLYAQRKIDEKLEELITRDQLFLTDPVVANTLAWGLTFYLSETYPRRYFKYLKNDGQRNSFEAYLPARRLADFADAFGPDIDQLDAELRKFIFSL